MTDDLMEPYRPIVDQLVLNLTKKGLLEVSPAAKKALTSIATFDLETSIGVSPLSVQVSRFVHSVSVSFETNVARLELPTLPAPLELAGLGVLANEDEE